MPIFVICECGKRLRASDSSAGKRAKCPNCGFFVAIPQHESPSIQPDSPVKAPLKKPKEWKIWACFAAATILFVVLIAVFFKNMENEKSKRYVYVRVQRAKLAIAQQNYDEAIELLKDAMSTNGTTDLNEVKTLLKSATASKLVQQEARLVASAERAIEGGNLSEAVQRLKDRVASMMDPYKARAIYLLQQVETATSISNAADILRGLPTEKLNDPDLVNKLSSPVQFKYISLVNEFKKTVRIALPEEIRRREEFERQHESERLAKIERERKQKEEQETTARREAERKAEEMKRIAREEEKRRRSFSGRGPTATERFSLSEGLSVISLKHKGTRNFSAKLLNRDGDLSELLANLIGSCSISRAIGIKHDGDHMLSIDADGPWNIVITQPRPLSAEYCIFFYGYSTMATEQFKMSKGLNVFKMSHIGKSNFSVKLLDDNGTHVDLLANDIGKYEGSKAIKIKKTGIYILDVTADGEWSIDIE